MHIDDFLKRFDSCSIGLGPECFHSNECEYESPPRRLPKSSNYGRLQISKYTSGQHAVMSQISRINKHSFDKAASWAGNDGILSKEGSYRSLFVVARISCVTSGCKLAV
jgi:hypothetical protein